MEEGEVLLADYYAHNFHEVCGAHWVCNKGLYVLEYELASKFFFMALLDRVLIEIINAENSQIHIHLRQKAYEKFKMCLICRHDSDSVRVNQRIHFIEPYEL